MKEDVSIEFKEVCEQSNEYAGYLTTQSDIYNIIATRTWIFENYKKYDMDSIDIQDGNIVDHSLFGIKSVYEISFRYRKASLILKGKKEGLENKRLAETRRKLNILGNKLRLIGSDLAITLAETYTGNTIVLIMATSVGLGEFDLTKYDIDEVCEHAFRNSDIKRLILDGHKLDLIGASVVGAHTLETLILKGKDIKLNIKMSECNSLTEVKTEAGAITCIGESAFNCIGAFKRIDLSCVEEIGTRAFNTSGIQFSGKYDKLKVVGKAAFDGCKGVGDLELNGIEIIHNTAFRASGIHSIIIGDKCEKIGDGAFSLCRDLEYIDIKSNSIRHIGDYVFNECEKLKKLVIPEGVETIDERAFFRSGIMELLLPRSYTQLEGKKLTGLPYGARIRVYDGEGTRWFTYPELRKYTSN